MLEVAKSQETRRQEEIADITKQIKALEHLINDLKVNSGTRTKLEESIAGYQTKLKELGASEEHEQKSVAA